MNAKQSSGYELVAPLWVIACATVVIAGVMLYVLIRAEDALSRVQQRIEKVQNDAEKAFKPQPRAKR